MDAIFCQPDIINIIYSLLHCPAQQFMFVLTCKKIYTIAGRRPRNDLRKYIMDYSKVAKLAMECDGIVIGRFLLSYLLGTEYLGEIEIFFDTDVESCDLMQRPKIKHSQYEAFINKLYETTGSKPVTCMFYDNDSRIPVCVERIRDADGKTIDIRRFSITTYFSDEKIDDDIYKIGFKNKLRVANWAAILDKCCNERDETKIFASNLRPYDVIYGSHLIDQFGDFTFELITPADLY